MTRDEMKVVMRNPKSISHLQQYKKIYEELFGKEIPGGCTGCKLTWLYNTILRKLHENK